MRQSDKNYIGKEKRIMKTKIIPFGNAPNAVPRVTVNSKASGQASLKNQKQEEKKGDNYGRI